MKKHRTVLLVLFGAYLIFVVLPIILALLGFFLGVYFQTNIIVIIFVFVLYVITVVIYYASINHDREQLNH